MATMPEHVAAK